jgi:hypothetical protein
VLVVSRLLRRRYRGRHAPGSVRDWPLAFRPMVDPWRGMPLFSVAHERQRFAADRALGLPL